MNPFLPSQIFFIISAVGFVGLGVLTEGLLFYLIRISRSFARIIDKAEKDIDQIGDTTKEILEEVHDSALFQLLTKFFKPKKRRIKHRG